MVVVSYTCSLWLIPPMTMERPSTRSKFTKIDPIKDDCTTRTCPSDSVMLFKSVGYHHKKLISKEVHIIDQLWVLTFCFHVSIMRSGIYRGIAYKMIISARFPQLIFNRAPGITPISEVSVSVAAVRTIDNGNTAMRFIVKITPG